MSRGLSTVAWRDGMSLARPGIFSVQFKHIWRSFLALITNEVIVIFVTFLCDKFTQYTFLFVQIASDIWWYFSEIIINIYYFAPSRGAKYCILHVYMPVCMSVHISKTTCPDFTKFLVHVNHRMAQSFFDNSATCYVLLVLWMFAPTDRLVAPHEMCFHSTHGRWIHSPLPSGVTSLPVGINIHPSFITHCSETS